MFSFYGASKKVSLFFLHLSQRDSQSKPQTAKISLQQTTEKRKDGRKEGWKGKTERHFPVATEKNRVAVPRQVRVGIEYTVKGKAGIRSAFDSPGSSKGTSGFGNTRGEMGRSKPLLSVSHQKARKWVEQSIL